MTHVSPDGNWEWDGAQWVARQQSTPHPIRTQERETAPTSWMASGEQYDPLQQAHGGQDEPDVRRRQKAAPTTPEPPEKNARDSGKPWYREAATLIALAAAAISLISALFTIDQNQQSTRAELGQLIQRLAALPKENATLEEEYSEDQALLASLQSSAVMETAVLAQRAADLADHLPKDMVSANEYAAVANALIRATIYDRAVDMTERGIELSPEPLTLQALLHSQAQALFLMGRETEARIRMREALAAWEGEPDARRLGPTAFTHLQWAMDEFSVGNCKEVVEHLMDAAPLIAGMAASPAREQLLSTASAIEAEYPNCRPLLPGDVPTLPDTN